MSEEHKRSLEERLHEWMRHGDMEKVHWVENVNKKLMPSVLQRIKNNDKTVLREVVVPKWLDWELLREIVDRKPAKDRGGRHCILCDMMHENGIQFNEKFLCEDCFLKLKYMDAHKPVEPEELSASAETGISDWKV